MSAEAKMYEEIAVSLGEIVRVLRDKHPRILGQVLDEIDLSDEALDEYMDTLNLDQEQDDEQESEG